MPKLKGRPTTKYLHIFANGKMEAYRVGDYEHDLLKQIQEFEHFLTEAETLRVILREAARIRNLHPRLTPLAPDAATPSPAGESGIS